MARTTGTWGSIERIGNGYRGTYVNPIKGAKPSRIKGPVFKTKGETHAWLEQEHAAVREHRQGIRRWTPPQECQVQLQQELLRQNITLTSYAKKWLANYHTKTGSEPAEAYKRKLREYQRWLERTCPFWNNLIINITEAEVTKWRNHAQIPAHPKNKAWFQLKQIMEQAKNEGLIRQNPVIGTTPRMPRSKQADTAQNLRHYISPKIHAVQLLIFLHSGHAQADRQSPVNHRPIDSVASNTHDNRDRQLYRLNRFFE